MSNDPPKARRLYLATRDGRRVGPEAVTGNVPSTNAPEAPLEVAFVGLTEDEQRAALAAFPGGRRFRLKLGR